MEKIDKFQSKLDIDISSYREKLYEEIRSDKEFYDSLINDDNFLDEEIKTHIAKFYKEYLGYLTNKKLKKYEDCLKNNEFYRYKLIKNENNIIEETYKEYDVYHKFMEYKKKFSLIDFNINEFYNLSFKDIPREEPKKSIVNEVNKGQKFFFIYGGHQTYKSYLSIAIVNALAKRNYSSNIVFLSCPKRFKELSDLFFSKDKASFDEAISKISNANTLVLDSLGEEYINDITRDLILIPILKERSKSKNNKFTIINSIYSLEDLRNVYAIKSKNYYISNEITNLIKSSITLEYNSGKLALK